MANSVLKNMKPLSGLLEAQAAMNPKKGAKKNSNFAASLNLTALIDAFAILVIFLLSNYNSDSQNLDFSSKTQLPKASYAEVLNLGTVIKIQDGAFLVDDQRVSLNGLVQKLLEAKKSKKDQAEEIKNSLIILADRDLSFEDLSPVIRAGGQAGFNSYKFAVLPGASPGQTVAQGQ